MPAYTDRFSAIDAFERELIAFGLVLRGGVVADGKIHRLDDGQQGKKNNKNGWYVLHESDDGFMFGGGGSWWGDRGKFSWHSRGKRPLTKVEMRTKAKVEAQVAEDEAERHRKGAQVAAQIWAAGTPCSSHPYLDRKRVQSHGLRVSSTGELLVPLYDFDGNLHGVQRILPHKLPDGRDKFFTKGTNRDLPTHYVIGQLDGAEIIAVAEGYATGATTHEATGWPVVVTFDAGCLEKIARPLRAKYPRANLVFAGDHDLEEKGGTGQKKAKRAAQAAGGVAVMPPTEGHDWNDHAAEHGVEDVGNRLLKAAGIVALPETVTLGRGREQLRQQVSAFFKIAKKWNSEEEAREARVAAFDNDALWEAEKAVANAKTKARTRIEKAKKKAAAALAEGEARIGKAREKAAAKADAANAKPTKNARAAADAAARKVLELEKAVEAEAIDLAARVAKAKKKAQRKIWKRVRTLRALKAAMADTAPELMQQRPVHLVNVSMGLGKTHETRERAGILLRKDRTASVDFAVPTHRLTNEQAAAFKAETGFDAAIWQGMKRPDPEHDDGRLMCVEPELVKAAEEASVDQAMVCNACPSRDVCGYRRQQKQEARAWFFPHNLLYGRKPRAIPAPSVLVIDEAFHGPGMIEESSLAASTLQIDLSDIEDEADQAILEQANRKLFAALESAAARATAEKNIVRLTRADLEATGITAETAKEARKVAWGRKPKPKLSGDAATMTRELKALAGHFTPKVPILWGMVRDLLESEHDIAAGIEVEPNARLKGGDGFGLMVLMSYRREIHESWHAPTLLLDGTAKPEIGKRWFPELVAQPEIHVEAPHQRNDWVRSSFAKARFQQTETASEKRNAARANNVDDLRRYIEVQAARYRTGRNDRTVDVLVVVNEAVEFELRKGILPANVALEHFNNLRGSNDYSDARAVIVVGRTLPNAETIQLQAERMAGYPLAQDDPLVEAVRWSICEAELLQIVARGRGIRRTEENPLDVHVLGDVALPLPFDLVMSWEQAQPTPIELLAARGAEMDCGRETKSYWPTVAAWLPDLYATPDAARFGFAAARSDDETSINRSSIDVSSRQDWLRLSARPPGSRYSVPVLVDPARREALGALVELTERKPAKTAKHAPGPKFAAVMGFLVDCGIMATEAAAGSHLLAKMLPTAFPTPQDAEAWLDAIPTEDRGFDVPEADLARDWQPETVYFDQGDELIEVPVMIAADARDQLARRLWLARPEPEIEALLPITANLVATLGDVRVTACGTVAPMPEPPPPIRATANIVLEGATCQATAIVTSPPLPAGPGSTAAWARLACSPCNHPKVRMLACDAPLPAASPPVAVLPVQPLAIVQAAGTA